MFQEPTWQWGTSVSLTTLLVAATNYGQWVMAERVWIICGMALTRKNRSTRWRTCLSVSLSTIKLTRAPLSSKHCLRGERPLTDRLVQAQGRAFPLCVLIPRLAGYFYQNKRGFFDRVNTVKFFKILTIKF